jgi:hypothetical protein
MPRALSIFMMHLIFRPLGGCSGNVGVGMSVGVPIGNHGYISMGTGTGYGRWY